MFDRIIGRYSSLIEDVALYFNLDKDSTEDEILQEIEKKHKKIKKEGKYWILIFDEFGKYLEYAAQNSPEKELERIIQGSFEIHNTINIRHLLSHREIHATLIHVTLESEQLLNVDGKSGRFFSLGEIEDLPKPRLIEGYLQDSVLIG